MKKTVLFSIIAAVYMCAFAQTEEAIYSISGSSIVTKSKFIDPFVVDNSTVLTPYILKETATLIPSSIYGSFSLRLSKFNGYEGEPGFCNVIDVLKNETLALRLTNSSGFAKISSYVFGESGDYTFKNLAADTYILIFNEWIYASQPSMVTVILIRQGEVALVYNKPMFIYSMMQKDGDFSMVLQANTCEIVGDSTVPENAPDKHTLWWDGSVLRFK